MSVLLGADVTAPRVRAAIAYAGFEQKEAAEKTGLSYDTLKRLAAKKNPRAANIDELWTIADACGVPRAFMEHGFGQVAGGLDAHRDEVGRNVTDRLLDIEEVIRSVEPRLALLEAAHRKQREGQAPADTPGRAAQGRNRRRRAGG